jgi:prepilin peptidase CpaA
LLGAWQGTFLNNILGLFIGILIYWPFFALGYMGGGDVKLMGAIGCFVGVEETILTMVLASLWGGIIALVALVKRKKHIRYGLAIGLGFLTLQVLQWLNLPLPYLY